MTKTKALLLIGLALVVGVLLLATDNAVEQEGRIKPPPAITWCEVAKSSTPKAYLPEFSSDWLDKSDKRER